MSGKSDDLKGRIEEAAGDLTDDERLKRQGKTDRAAGKIKEKVDEKVGDVADAVKERA